MLQPQEKQTFILQSKISRFDARKSQEKSIAKINTRFNASILLFWLYLLLIYEAILTVSHVHSKQIGGYRRAFLEPYAAVLTEQLSIQPSMTLKDIQDWLECEQALTVSISCIDEFLRLKLGYRFKKTVVASEPQRDDVAAAREQWQAWQQSCDLSKLVFLDETGLSTDMIRRYIGGTY